MKRKDFDRLIDGNSFCDLFITEMGWNNPAFSKPIYITIDDTEYAFTPVAEKSGFQVYSCEVDSIPTAAECKKIDNQLRKDSYDYICIFVQSGTHHHLWLTPVKTNEKRELVKTEYIGGAKADFLFSKIDDLTFDLQERVLISDVKAKVQGSFHLNSEKVTKDFYAQFRKEHTAFKKYISGIADEKNRDWYASVMLNRLMFCYFIQKKGFLDLNKNYLQDKLQWVKQQQGEDQFFGSFYQGFLCALFHDGLNNPCHDSQEFIEKYGRIPYLNGGMFDEHQLERENKGIDIADVAFENLFTFFDKWNWHLDTRLTASGKDINPDVLGYIFEQYINDRAAMGAYYTKEDITEYIGKNCIIPFLMDKTAEKSKEAFKPTGFVWQTLQHSGDKYIYDAVKKGYTHDWQQRLPDYISQGIDTTQGDLLQRRVRWNERTHDDFALPTEIWRETVERLQRCDTLLQKINSGEILSINDFITYNLNIRLFAEDVLRCTDDHLFILHFYHALQGVTILDPTCGSGAFLFAALNILEPLYEACLDRMEEWHKQNANLFQQELEELQAKYSSNRQYFIYKSIILRNLYGVDIMVEATEIAKLRLFLKMVAVVDVDKRKDNLGLDPLPDIDFNIKCGNTLVGYATEKELNYAFLNDADIFAKQEFEDKIKTEMQVVATAYNCFRSEQLKAYDDNASIKATKEMLRKRLTGLNDLLNRHMYKTIANSTDYDAWLKSHQPFHWLAEFYQIIHDNGGFDVIIGNPPYVEYNKKDSKTKKAISDIYKIRGYKTEECGNLYAFVMERTKSITRNASYIGMIVPLSGHSTERMAPLVKNFYNAYGLRLHLNLSADANPQKLFEGVKFRLCIFFVSNAHKGHYSTKYIRWYAEERDFLFKKINYVDDSTYSYGNIIGKIPSPFIISAFNKMQTNSYFFYTKYGEHKCLYHNTPVNWIRSHSFIPYFSSERDGEGITTQLKVIPFENKNEVKVASALINSSLFFIWWIVNSDCYHLNKTEISEFRFDYNANSDNELIAISDELAQDMLRKSKRRVYNYRTSGRVEYDEFYMKLSKPIIDEIDKVLAKHYGFTEEELDFIINYDIKYRMGDELYNEKDDK